MQNQPPPPPYQQSSRTYSMNAANVLQAYAVSQQQTQCPIHQRQPCSCTQNSTEVCQYVNTDISMNQNMISFICNSYIQTVKFSIC